MLGDSRAIMHPKEQSRATSMFFACFKMKTGSTTPIQCRSIAETNVMTLVSFFVIVLLSVLLLSCLTGLVKLKSLVGLTAQRASAAGQGV